MKEKSRVKSILELPLMGRDTTGIRRKVTCVSIGYEEVVRHFSSPVYQDTLFIGLVLSGTGNLSVNYKFHKVSENSLFTFSSSHLFRFESCSEDFCCLCLLVSKEFMDEMDSTDMIYQRIKYGVKMYNRPVLSLSKENAALLAERIHTIDESLEKGTHFYYKEMVLNRMFAFYLDLSDIIERHGVSSGEGNANRYESIMHSFIELLSVHYRQEHGVGFYASALHLSPHYLTRIVKRITGQSVCDFIFDMLYSEALTLLTYSDLSIQQIAGRLHFSDQSAFGKFFKRNAGISPADYRKNNVLIC